MSAQVIISAQEELVGNAPKYPNGNGKEADQ